MKNNADLQKYLAGVEYPATRQDLADAAGDNGAPDDVLETIEAMPEREYMNPADVSKEAGK
jgi:hypothetical protein